MGPPWRVVDRRPDIAEALARVKAISDRIAHQVAVPPADWRDGVQPTAEDWLALFDLVVHLARRTGGPEKP